MNKKIALISVGMNTPLKIQEEQIWANWFRGMFGDDAYLINNVSMIKNGTSCEKNKLIDHSEKFENPGHLPGCCKGLNMGLDHLKSINYDGPVVLTVCDVIANEPFANITNVSDFDADIYTHDWGPEHIATDWIILSPDIWKDFEFPSLAGENQVGQPVLKDYVGRLFIAADRTPVLEKWNDIYIKEKGWKNKYFTSNDSPGFDNPEGKTVGVKMTVSDIEFSVVQSGGDARPTKTHLTNQYMEFDRDFVAV